MKARPDEERTLDQLRADAFGDLLVDGDTTSIGPEGRGIRATVAVTVPVLSLLDGSSGGTSGVAHPGVASPSVDSPRPASRATADGVPVVEGLGPIPVDVARDLCAGADDWMRVLTHPETGIVLSVGRTQYRPPPSMRRLIRWRSDRCMAPGCGVPASRCEIDHTVAWQHGGHTGAQNLAPLCKGHHSIKHHGGWTVEQRADSGGALHWISPSGRAYVVKPERDVPTFRPSTDGSAPF
ncbi:HNH endonuclease [Microbacterium sp. NPDC057407]|uniref:HNH endonuclease signature motif containing protein n=1 Tax=Microbacterium sp. NPDC057407 TaxID=3346120 RepID=UPI00366E5BC4